MKKLKFYTGLYAMIVALFSFILTIACNSGPPSNSREAQAKAGKLLFDQYCVTCHGVHGDGPLADSLSIPPPDLTRIMERRGATEFPVQDVARFIDGRQWVSAHGAREMPTWGKVFSENKMSEDEITGKLGELIAYLMSIQSR